MKSVCKVEKNHHIARFTGNYFPWLCHTPDGIVYCDTREDAREVAREYNAERRRLIREGEKLQAKLSFYND